MLFHEQTLKERLYLNEKIKKQQEQERIRISSWEKEKGHYSKYPIKNIEK